MCWPIKKALPHPPNAKLPAQLLDNKQAQLTAVNHKFPPDQPVMAVSVPVRNRLSASVCVCTHNLPIQLLFIWYLCQRLINTNTTYATYRQWGTSCRASNPKLYILHFYEKNWVLVHELQPELKLELDMVSIHKLQNVHQKRVWTCWQPLPTRWVQCLFLLKHTAMYI